MDSSEWIKYIFYFQLLGIKVESESSSLGYSSLFLLDSNTESGDPAAGGRRYYCSTSSRPKIGLARGAHRALVYSLHTAVVFAGLIQHHTPSRLLRVGTRVANNNNWSRQGCTSGQSSLQ
jgi:hypothetical protein